MARYHWVAPRLTHKYVGTWQHMDQWGDAIRVKLLAPKVVEQGNGFEYGPTTVQRVIAPRNADPKAVARALYDEFNQHGCSHEYDCCGCASYRADVKQVGKREFNLTISTSYNY